MTTINDANQAPHNEVSDLQSYIQQRKLSDPVFAEDFDAGFEAFKAEVLLQFTEDGHQSR